MGLRIKIGLRIRGLGIIKKGLWIRREREIREDEMGLRIREYGLGEA